MKRQIIGIQLHHSVFLDDAMRGAVNTRAGLAGAIARTGDNDLIDLAWRFEGILKEVIAARDAASRRLRDMPTEEVVECREGRRPWPDELTEGFVPRCTCYDTCRIHQHGRSEEEGWKCQCAPCPAHEEAA